MLRSQIGLQLWNVDAWEMFRGNIKISTKECLSYYDLKKHKPWVDEGCSKLLDQWNQGKFQW
jgi:hypothetical protein